MTTTYRTPVTRPERAVQFLTAGAHVRARSSREWARLARREYRAAKQLARYNPRPRPVPYPTTTGRQLAGYWQPQDEDARMRAYRVRWRHQRDALAAQDERDGTADAAAAIRLALYDDARGCSPFVATIGDALDIAAEELAHRVEDTPQDYEPEELDGLRERIAAFEALRRNL